MGKKTLLPFFSNRNVGKILLKQEGKKIERNKTALYLATAIHRNAKRSGGHTVLLTGVIRCSQSSLYGCVPTNKHPFRHTGGANTQEFEISVWGMWAFLRK